MIIALLSGAIRAIERLERRPDELRLLLQRSLESNHHFLVSSKVCSPRGPGRIRRRAPATLDGNFRAGVAFGKVQCNEAVGPCFGRSGLVAARTRKQDDALRVAPDVSTPISTLFPIRRLKRRTTATVHGEALSSSRNPTSRPGNRRRASGRSAFTRTAESTSRQAARDDRVRKRDI
jgi:hypothetical protein